MLPSQRGLDVGLVLGESGQKIAYSGKCLANGPWDIEPYTGFFQ